MTYSAIDERAVNAIRFLSIDAIQQANSGHPGIAMGSAPASYVLWDRFLLFNPKNPAWFNRDRFILSAGHGSTLLYSLLHLYGYDSISMEDMKRFRQLDSRTPGHPENQLTPGVEVTTGPLGQGIANGVGMAMAEAHLAARFNKPDCALVDHYIYALMGDGCHMEGISGEACSLAGHLGLGKLIALYDDNKISIDGSTDLAFTEDVGKRFEAYGWHVETVSDGNTDLAGIEKAIARAKAETDRPSLIKVSTTIGFGSPNLAGSSDTHGAPLGPEEIQLTRENLNWDAPPFNVPEDVQAHVRGAIDKGAAREAAWNNTLAEYREKYPADAAAFEALTGGGLPDGWQSELPGYSPEDGVEATRASSGKCLNAVAETLDGLMGGSADLAPSNKTVLSCSDWFRKGGYENRNVHFGVREHAMGAICNGMALHGSGLIPYCATFLSFADYVRPAIRLSALSGAGVIYVMTHDSVAVGEDGPTHQPVEQLASLRAMPNLVVVRPADGNETVGAYKLAIAHRDRPTLIALSRQKLPQLTGSSADDVAKGAYTISDDGGTPDILLIGAGAELSLCTEAAKVLRADGAKVRVVSMPCCSLFDSQEQAYRESVLPGSVKKRLVVEAATDFGWVRYAGDQGSVISINRFGLSAPGGQCLETLGYTVENVVARAKQLLS
jgi:transketolase